MPSREAATQEIFRDFPPFLQENGWDSTLYAAAAFHIFPPDLLLSDNSTISRCLQH